jgi:choline dehydrogenase
MPNPMSTVFLEACAELGFARTSDFNGPQMLGAGWHHIDVKDAKRQGALVSFLQPALRRSNVTLRTGAMATGLTWRETRCTGVTYRQRPVPQPTGPGRRLHNARPTPAGVHTAVATREVVVCGGAIESPKFLMLSGVGPANALRSHGIDVVADVPGVGENFHNHVLVGLVAEARGPVQPGRQNLSEAALFTTSQPGMIAPDIQIAFVHVPFDIAVGQQHPNAVSLLPGVVRPTSRGWVRLADADPMSAPLVNPNYLGDSADLDRLVDAVSLSRDIFATSAFSAVLSDELVPGPDVTTRDQLVAFVRARADSYHHQAGSCRMGIDDLAVVDPLLRVRGAEGLRVADASVMPAVPSGNCHTAVVAIAERAADLIKES